MPTRPRIAITMGDAAGVGPEVIMKALAHHEPHAIARPLVVGDAKRLVRAGEIVRTGLAVRAIAAPDDAVDLYPALDPARLAVPSVAALTLAVGDIAATARVLAHNAIAFDRDRDGSLIVPPTAACGVLLEFKAPSS